MDDSAKGRYNIILRQYLLIELLLNLNLSEHVPEAYDGNFNGSTTPTIDFGTYIFKCLNTVKLHLKNFN